MAELLLARRTIPWGVRASETSRPVPTPIKTVNNKPQIAEQRNIIPGEMPFFFLTGYGQERRVSRVVSWLGTQNVFAEGIMLPVNEIPASKFAVQTLSREGLHVAAEEIKTQENVPQYTRIDLLGISQGGGIVFDALKNGGHIGIRNIVSVAPVGFRPDESKEGKTEAQLRRLFVRRFAGNAFRQPPFEGETWGVGKDVTRQMVFDMRTKRWVPKLGYALTAEAQVVAVAHANRGNSIAIILGSKDRVFPPDEVQASVMEVTGYQAGNPEFIIMSATHPAPNSRKGREMLMQGVTFLQRVAA